MLGYRSLTLCIIYFQRLSTVMPQFFRSTVKGFQIREKSRNQRVLHPGTAGECQVHRRTALLTIILLLYNKILDV